MIRLPSYESFVGKIIRLPLRLIPGSAVLSIRRGPLRKTRWIKGAGVNGYWLGTYEREKQEDFFSAIQPGSTVFDIGAHAGFYALLAARAAGPDGRIYAFEPFPQNIFYLKKHKALNSAGNIEVIEGAVTARDGEVLFKEGRNTSTGSVGEGDITVQGISLDSFIKKIGAMPDVIKIDVEGGGAGVLLGAENILAIKKPVIFFALHNKAEREAAKMLSGRGYKIELMGETSLNEADEIKLIPY